MRHYTLSPLLIAAATLAVVPIAARCAKTWTDPEKAAAENTDFRLQGEYAGTIAGKKAGVQVAALGNGKFALVTLAGGLPGDGWDGKTRAVFRGAADGTTIALAGDTYAKAVIKDGVMTLEKPGGAAAGELKKVERTSPTAGAAPPDGAVVLFDGTDADAFKNAKIDGTHLREGTQTKQSFGAFRLHLEFRMPYKPERFPSNQDRGNSGIYIFNRYETQLLDSFGLHYNHFDKNVWKEAFKKEMGSGPNSDRTQWCCCLYKFRTPAVNMCFPPLSWQTYDIDFTPAVFDGKKKTAHARITVRHNGVTVLEDVELTQGGTGAGRGRTKKHGEVTEGPIILQGHGNPVHFRNIWLVEKK